MYVVVMYLRRSCLPAFPPRLTRRRKVRARPGRAPVRSRIFRRSDPGPGSSRKYVSLRRIAVETLVGRNCMFMLIFSLNTFRNAFGAVPPGSPSVRLSLFLFHSLCPPDVYEHLWRRLMQLVCSSMPHWRSLKIPGLESSTRARRQRIYWHAVYNHDL